MLRRCPRTTLPGEPWTATPTKTAAARRMRKASTVSERLLWNALRGRRLLGLKFRRQHVIGGYVADFYCAELSLVIEVDGPVHDADEDRVRDGHLAFLNVVVLRIASSEVETTLSQVVEDIEAACNDLRR